MATQKPLASTPDVGPATVAPAGPPVGGLDLKNIQGDILCVEISTAYIVVTDLILVGAAFRRRQKHSTFSRSPIIPSSGLIFAT